MATTPIGDAARHGTCVHDTHNRLYNELIDARLYALETRFLPFVDQTGLGVQTAWTVPDGTRRVRVLWGATVNTVTWPGVLSSDSLGYQFHGLYNQFPSAPAQHKVSVRVVADGTVEIGVSGPQDTVDPTAIDVWIVR